MCRRSTARTCISDLDAERGSVVIDKMVFAEVAVDPGRHLEEAAFVQELADADPRLCGMIAHLPLEKGKAVEADLARLQKFRTSARHPPADRDRAQSRLLPRATLPRGPAAPAQYDLSFDICVKHWAMTYALELVKRCPEVSFVLDHIGKPDIKNGLREPWWSQIRELARLPNVVVKLSGVITEADHGNWTADQVKPYVAHVIDCFGFDRVMYGSDWTVSELTHKYPLGWPSSTRSSPALPRPNAASSIAIRR